MLFNLRFEVDQDIKTHKEKVVKGKIISKGSSNPKSESNGKIENYLHK